MLHLWYDMHHLYEYILHLWSDKLHLYEYVFTPKQEGKTTDCTECLTMDTCRTRETQTNETHQAWYHEASLLCDFASACVHVCVCVHVCMCVCVYICTCFGGAIKHDTDTRTHAHINTHQHTQARAHTHTRARALVIQASTRIYHFNRAHRWLRRCHLPVWMRRWFMLCNSASSSSSNSGGSNCHRSNGSSHRCRK